MSAESDSPGPASVPEVPAPKIEESVVEGEAQDEPKLTLEEFVQKHDPSDLDEETRSFLDDITGISREEAEISVNRGLEASDESAAVGRMRDLCYKFYETREELDKLKRPAKFERLLMKEYLSERSRLQDKLDATYRDLVALGEEEFNSVNYSPVAGVMFVPHANEEVTVAWILSRVGRIPEEPEPEENVNPSWVS